VFTYTLAYRVIAITVTPAALGVALAAVPTDPNIEAALGLTPLGDVTATDAISATRTIQYTSPDGNQVEDLTGIWSGLFSRPLVSLVEAAPVTVV
jgi:hypothetical protein